MGLIKIPVPDRAIEHTSLEAHVVISEQRHRRLEDRIRAAESELKELHDQNRSARKMIIGGLIWLQILRGKKYG